MKISKQARRDAKQLFRCCLVNGLLDENRARLAAQRLATEKPRGFAGILSRFHRLVQLEIARRTATVESALTLTETLRDQVKSHLNRRYGAGLHLTFKVSPALIGGLRIQVGSDVFDGSVQARLAALQDSF
jgi:F-type H+-transporting ATPase subunit delta